MALNNKEQEIQQQIEEITGQSVGINQDTCYDLVKQFRRYHIKKILLLSPSFEYFLLEEEGRLITLFAEWCAFDEQESPPTIVHVETVKEGVSLLEKENFDLIILFFLPQNDSIHSVIQQLGEKAQAPMVLLGNNNADLAKIADKKTPVTKFFTWNGDGKIILSIVQYFEDKQNVKSSSSADGRKCILLLEDSIQHYSSYLALIYEEICLFLHDVLQDDLSCEQKTLRFKRRPFVIHAENLEEGLSLYEQYKDDLIGVVTDNCLGKKQDAGIAFTKKITQEKPEMSVLIQSSDPIEKKGIDSKNIQYISKLSQGSSFTIRNFIRQILGPRKLEFTNETGDAVFHVQTMKDFKRALTTLDSELILQEVKNHKISKWLKMIGEVELGEKCLTLERESQNGDLLKSRLNEALEEYHYSINRTAISSFARSAVDPLVKMSRIGDGALGGKARGTAFLAKILSKYLSEDMFPGLRITIPRSVILTTDIFDKFIQHNHLSDIDVLHTSDERIAAKYMEASIPATVIGDLRAFIRTMRKPLIVRSSGLLEDSLMQPFAGIYASMILPNESWETDFRFQEVCNAIKYVYASTYFERARTYIKSTPKNIGDEKMAVLIQELAGDRHGPYFYPPISGVAKSYNYYPSGPCKPEDGIVYLALGLGKEIVGGGSTFAFCPERPKAPLFGTPKDYMKYAQTHFYALNLKSIYRFVDYNEETSLEKLDIDIAKQHGVLDKIVSTYVSQDDKLYPGIYDEGSVVVDFSPIINYDEIPLTKAIKLLLRISELALGYPVEIEFAVTIPQDKKEPAELVILQIRNMISPDKKIDINIENIPKKDTLIYSENALGNGIANNIPDIVYINQDVFDLSQSSYVVKEIRKINTKLMNEKKPYVLIGPGRWGSSDPWLGIPVIWSDVAGAKVIVETPYKERHIDPSQGSHFFHDMIASEVGYLITKKEEDIDWKWLASQEKVEETKFITHVKARNNLQAIIDGKKGKAIIRQQPDKKKIKESGR